MPPFGEAEWTELFGTIPEKYSDWYLPYWDQKNPMVALFNSTHFQPSPGKNLQQHTIDVEGDCPNITFDTLQELNTYRMAMRLENATIELHEKFQTILANFQKVRPDCYELAMSRHVLSSLYIYWLQIAEHPKNLNDKILQDEILLAATVATALARDGKIKFITPEVRGQTRGLWQKRNSNGEHEILGGYDCQTSTIFIDPTLAPFNLGATLVHELDHLFRDKYFDFSAQGLNAKTYLLMDELIASSHAGFLQKSLHFLSGYEIANDFIATKIPGATMAKDMDLFQPQGNLEVIWQNLADQRNEKNTLDFNSFVQKTLQQDRFGQNEIGEILKRVESAYFPGDQDSVSLSALLKKISNLNISPFSRWLRGKSLSHGFDLGDDLKSRKDSGPRQLGAFALELVRDLRSRLSNSSASCQILHQKDFASTQLKFYIGAQLSPPNVLTPGSQGVMPSHGVMPTRLLRPCLLNSPGL